MKRLTRRAVLTAAAPMTLAVGGQLMVTPVVRAATSYGAGVTESDINAAVEMVSVQRPLPITHCGGRVLMAATAGIDSEQMFGRSFTMQVSAAPTGPSR